MKLILITISALVCIVAAIRPKPDLICCRTTSGACPLPGDVLPRDFAILTPKGYLNERTGTLSARAEANCCCFADTQADCRGSC